MNLTDKITRVERSPLDNPVENNKRMSLSDKIRLAQDKMLIR